MHRGCVSAITQTLAPPCIDKDDAASLYFRKGDEARPFFSSEWRIRDDARILVFCYHDPQTTHIRLHAIKDYIS
jgi:hypothetical protein